MAVNQVWPYGGLASYPGRSRISLEYKLAHQ